MKKTIITLGLLVFILAFSACKKEIEIIMPNEVDSNTLLIEKDGVVEFALIEEFAKDYYDINEFKDFATNYINEYNIKQGQKVASLKDAKTYKNNAIANIRFKDLSEYGKYQDVYAVSYALDESIDEIEKLPETLTKLKKKKTVEKVNYIKTKDSKILIINDDLDILIDGQILYYSGNVNIKNSHAAQIKKGQDSIIIYK